MEGTHQQHSVEGGGAISIPMFVTAAHELKSPLALIRQLSLSLESGNNSPQDAQEIARQITLTSERALRLTTNLTKTVRLEDSLFDMEPLNPLSVCNEIVRELTPLYAAKGRELKLVTRTRPVLGLANRDLLRRILTNFVDNALHYADSTSPVLMSVSSYGNGDRIRVGVRDYGPAVSSKMRQLMRTSGDAAIPMIHDRPESSGLGIYIARQFAQAMQAQIGTVRHKDGATFYVDISSSTQLRLL